MTASAIRSLVLVVLVAGLLTIPTQGRGLDTTDACGDPGVAYAEIQIDTYPRISLELARTPQEHQVGLMFREFLPSESGMLFVYDHRATEGYWMRNTYVPLSIAWIDQNGAIVDIQDMQPQTDDVHIPAAAYWYALEVNQGWFVEHGVGVGQQVAFCLSA